MAGQSQTKDEIRAAIIGMGGEARVKSSMTKAELQHVAETMLLEQNGNGEEPKTIGDLVAEKDAPAAASLADFDAATEPATALVLHEQPDTLPTYSRWQQMEQMADRMARSNLVPAPLRGKPADVLIVMLGAHDLGITATQGLQKLHVIDGKLGMASEMMVALVLGRGHELWPDPANDEQTATAHGRRKGSEQVGSFTFTMADAERAGLPGRSRYNGKVGTGTYDKYPKAMLWARAVSGLCRQMFPDVIAGVSYTPEELGAIDAEGYESPTRQQQAEPERPAAGEDVKQGIKKRLAELTDEQRACIATAWKEHDPVLFPLAQLHADEVGAVLAMIAECVSANPPDAEVVPAGNTGDGNDECIGCSCIEPLNDAGLCADCAAAEAQS